MLYLLCCLGILIVPIPQPLENTRISRQLTSFPIIQLFSMLHLPGFPRGYRYNIAKTMDTPKSYISNLPWIVVRSFLDVYAGYIQQGTQPTLLVLAVLAATPLVLYTSLQTKHHVLSAWRNSLLKINILRAAIDTPLPALTFTYMAITAISYHGVEAWYGLSSLKS
jgi:hypothetical protein